MRRLAPIVLALLGAAVAPRGARAQAIPVGPGGQLASVVGVPFSTPIVADMTARTEKIGSFAARLLWNPAVLHLDTLLNGSFGTVTANTDSATNGILRLAGVNPAGAGGLVSLATLRFTPLTGDTTTLGLSLGELYAAGSFANLLPSAVVSSGLFCAASGTYGDINQDGSVNSLDALIAVSTAVGLNVGTFNLALGDVDASGVTDTRDALIILSYSVGLDVSGFRVTRLAGGACTTNGALAMSITPSPLGLVLGQSAQLEARAANGSGALQSLPDVVWRSSASGVASVTADGRVTAVSAGSAVITALRGISDSAKVTVTVVAGRTRHVVDATAVNAANQLGSATLPFGTIAGALGFARAGDTIEIRPGRYDESDTLALGVVLLGDTLADGSRPVITGRGLTGLELSGAGWRQIYNVAFDSAYVAIEVNGPDSVLLRGVRGTRLSTGVLVSSALAVLRIQQSALIGTGVASCCDGSGIDAGYTNEVQSLDIEDTEIGDFDENAIYAEHLDSLTIRRSNLHDFGEYGVELGGYGQSLALVVDSSTIQRSSYELFYVEDLRSGLITRSVLANNENDYVFDQYQEEIPNGGYLVLRNDSISVRDNSWLEVEGLDSLVIDSLRAVLPDAYSDIYDVPLVRVSRSSFRNVSDEVLYISFGGSGGGGVVTVTNSSFVGDPNCDLCAEAIYTESARTTVDSASFTNIYEPVRAYGDSSLTVTNSTFRRVEYAVEFEGNYSVGCPTCGGGPTVGLTMRNNTVNGFYYGVEADAGAMTIEDNTFLAGSSSGIETDGGSGQSIQRNVFDGVDDPIEVSLYDSSVTAVIADNQFTNSTGEAIYGYGSSSEDNIRTRFVISGNTIGCAGSYGDGIDVYYADAVVTNNQVLGCSSGIYVYNSLATPRTDSVIANSVALPANAYGGIIASYLLRSRISRNIVTGDTAGYGSYGDIAAQGYYLYYDLAAPRGTALIDSNSVSGGVYAGVYVADLDTAVVAQNTVQDVNDSYGAIAASGYLRYVAAIAGNTVRRARYAGITTSSSDTATVQVDSNLVSASGARGIDVEGGAAQITRNNVVNSGSDGIHVYSYAVVSLPITLNNITGNQFGLREDGQGVYAPSNWWGNVNGPSCAEGCASPAGDSVTSGVSFTPFLTAANPSGLPAALRAFAFAGASASRAALRVLPAREAALPAARTTAHRHAPAVRVAATASVSRIPASLPPARAQAHQARVQRQAARMAARQQVESRRSAQRAARESAQQARVAQVRARVTQARAAVSAARRAPAAPAAQRRP